MSESEFSELKNFQNKK